VQLANKFNSSVKVEKDGEAVDGKSIIAILSLGVNNGVSIRLVVEGDDAQEAMDDLKIFLETDDD
jgi:phosphotransferase system HPr (HPr) family protein